MCNAADVAMARQKLHRDTVCREEPDAQGRGWRGLKRLLYEL
jgi:hypothetical protein